MRKFYARKGEKVLHISKFGSTGRIKCEHFSTYEMILKEMWENKGKEILEQKGMAYNLILMSLQKNLLLGQ